MNTKRAATLLLAHSCLSLLPGGHELIAIGTVSGVYEDFATKTADPLENGIPGEPSRRPWFRACLRGVSLHSSLFPDRGRTPRCHNKKLASYINRFQTFHLSLAPATPGSPLPFTLTPSLPGQLCSRV
jgi:hypothetical protein